MDLRLEKIANGWLVHATGVGDRGSPNRHCDETVLSGANYCSRPEDVVAMFKDMAGQHFSLLEANHALVKEHFAEQRRLLKGK